MPRLKQLARLREMLNGILAMLEAITKETEGLDKRLSKLEAKRPQGRTPEGRYLDSLPKQRQGAGQMVRRKWMDLEPND